MSRWDNYGEGGDWCPECGQDWKCPHDPECSQARRCAYPAGCDSPALPDLRLCGRHYTGLYALLGPPDS